MSTGKIIQTRYIMIFSILERKYEYNYMCQTMYLNLDDIRKIKSVSKQLRVSNNFFIYHISDFIVRLYVLKKLTITQGDTPIIVFYKYK